MAVEIFIVAHSDDWFLFMGKAGTDAAADPGNTVVFVYLTASNFIDDTATATGTRVRLRYETGLRVREDATVATALTCCGLDSSLPQYFPLKDAANVKFDVKAVNGREIAYYEVANTRHYCLRLADGQVDGSGVAWNGNQSLRRLHEGATAMTAQGDIPARYDAWADLTKTLRAIFDAESNGQSCGINFLDPADAANPFPRGHSDHQHAGLAVQDAIANEARYAPRRFLGYTTVDRDPNADKRALLQTWDGVQTAFYPTINQGAYQAWIMREYRADGDEVPGRRRVVR